MRTLGVAAAALAVAATACTSGTATSPNSLAGQLTTRTVDLSVTGATPAAVTDAPATAQGGPAGFVVTYDGASTVTDVEGVLSFATGGGEGTLELDVTTDLTGPTGRATVDIPSSGVSVTVVGAVQGWSVDDLGNVVGQIASGGSSVTFATESVALPGGTDPALESLLAEETTWCQDVQQRLPGLDPAEVPLESITNVRGPSRAEFAGAKALLEPLTTQSWSDTADITTTAGGHATITNRISCKTRQADHLATLGLTTSSPDAQCSVVHQRAIDLALAQMTPEQQAAVTLPDLGADVVRQTGVEWTTPLAPAAEFSDNVLRAHALLTGWNDPQFAAFPETIRGVHYCTTWTPAFMYTHLLSTIPAP